MNLDCDKCLTIMLALSGGSMVGILTMKEGIASNAIEHGLSYEEMEERVFNHKEHNNA